MYRRVYGLKILQYTHTVRLCSFYGSYNKQQFFSTRTEQTDWLLEQVELEFSSRL
jgi:hypothetical protein